MPKTRPGPPPGGSPMVVDLRKLASHRLMDRAGARYCVQMLRPGWPEVGALVAAYVIAAVATPAGISGAVLLLPFQLDVLDTPSPAVKIGRASCRERGE